MWIARSAGSGLDSHRVAWLWAGGERRLLHDLSIEDRQGSEGASGMLPGDLNNDFESISRAVGVRQGQAGGLSGGRHNAAQSQAQSQGSLACLNEAQPARCRCEWSVAFHACMKRSAMLLNRMYDLSWLLQKLRAVQGACSLL